MMNSQKDFRDHTDLFQPFIPGVTIMTLVLFQLLFIGLGDSGDWHNTSREVQDIV